MSDYTILYVKEDGEPLSGLEVWGFPVGGNIISAKKLASVACWEDLGILCGHVAWYTPLSPELRGELLAIGSIL